MQMSFHLQTDQIGRFKNDFYFLLGTKFMKTLETKSTNNNDYTLRDYRVYLYQ